MWKGEVARAKNVEETLEEAKVDVDGEGGDLWHVESGETLDLFLGDDEYIVLETSRERKVSE